MAGTPRAAASKLILVVRTDIDLVCLHQLLRMTYSDVRCASNGQRSKFNCCPCSTSAGFCCALRVTDFEAQLIEWNLQHTVRVTN